VFERLAGPTTMAGRARRAAPPPRVLTRPPARRAAHYRALAACLIAGATLRGNAANASDQEADAGFAPHITAVHVGFDGYYKTGYWAPVEVQIQGAMAKRNSAVRLVLPDGDGVPTAISKAVQTSTETVPKQSKTVALTAKFGRADAGLTAQFVAGGHVRAQRRFAAGPQQDGRHIPLGLGTLDRLIVVVGADRGVAEAMRGVAREGPHEVHVVGLPDADRLPIRWLGYDAVDTLVLSASDRSALRAVTQDTARGNALIQWAERGGQVVLFVGREAAELLKEFSVLATLAPGSFDKLVSLSQAPALENYSQSEHPIGAGEPQTRLEVARIANVRGTIVAHEGSRPSDLPLVVRAPFGFGQVTIVTVDPDRPPLRDWKGRASFLRKVLDQGGRVDRQAPAADANPYSAAGYVDFTGQLRAAMDHFHNVRTVPFALVAGLVMVYILVIGPLDYWIVKKWFRRVELTWVTFPCWVILFSAGACLLAYWLKGRQLRVNQAEIVDVDVERRLLRGTVFTHLFSPRPATYDVAVRPALLAGMERQSEDLVVSWMGLPGVSLGGMGGSVRASSYFTRPYVFARGLDALFRVPVQIWSTKSFSTRWSATINTTLVADLREVEDTMLSGTLRNPWPFDLPRSHLLYGRWVYRLPPLEAGQVQEVNETLHPRFAKTWLRDQPLSRAFDVPGAEDVPQILSMMMFHKLAGGRQYTGLANQYHGECDLSDHLDNGRAVLVAWMPEWHSRLHLDGRSVEAEDDRYWSVFRFLIPVGRDARKP